MGSLARRTVALGLVAGLGLGVAACDTGDGRTLRAPPPGATAPPAPTSTTASTAPAVIGPPVGSEETVGLVLTSPAFADGAAIPARHSSCEGDNVSPALAWAGVPPGTVELALTVRDPDAPDGDFVHWVVTGLDPALTGIGEGGVPDGALEGRNDSSEFGWFGPCPPAGAEHRYVFTLFALTAASGIGSGADAVDILAAVDAIPSTWVTLTGTYGRAE